MRYKWRMNETALSSLPSSALTARLYDIRRAERGLLVELLTYLAEVDRRKVYAETGFPSNGRHIPAETLRQLHARDAGR